MLRNLFLFIQINRKINSTLFSSCNIIFKYFKIKFNKYLNLRKTFVVKDLNNLKFIYNPGCTISEKLYILGLYDYNSMNFLKDQLKSSDVFFDIGSNIGPFTLLASLFAKKVYSFEPHPKTFLQLNNNTLINNLINVKCINAAISDKNGYCSITDLKQSASNSILDEKNGIFQITKITIDTFIYNHNISLPTFLKIDVEGHELNAFNGLIHTLRSGSIKFIIFECNHLSNNVDILKIFDLLKMNNYIIGNIDFLNKFFVTIENPITHSSSGDFHAISKSFKLDLISSGYDFK
jgi:FkbM family methyltransferase